MTTFLAFEENHKVSTIIRPEPKRKIVNGYNFDATDDDQQHREHHGPGEAFVLDDHAKEHGREGRARLQELPERDANRESAGLQIREWAPGSNGGHLVQRDSDVHHGRVTTPDGKD